MRQFYHTGAALTREPGGDSWESSGYHRKREEAGVKDGFRRFAEYTAQATGKPSTFVLATALCLIWLVSGPLFAYSDTWQLWINTSTTVLTFLMVFVLQNTQNRDNISMQLKLDELLRAVKRASDDMIDIEHLSDDDLDKIAKKYEQMSKKAAEEHESRSRTRTAERG
jgi:low affinity Fe/Cu permease